MLYVNYYRNFPFWLNLKMKLILPELVVKSSVEKEKKKNLLQAINL